MGILEGKICASAMGGYDVHRGRVNYLAIAPSLQYSGSGKQIMSEVESHLVNKSCPKINVQIRSENIYAIEFYKKIGYSSDDVVCVGKRLTHDRL